MTDGFCKKLNPHCAMPSKKYALKGAHLVANGKRKWTQANKDGAFSLGNDKPLPNEEGVKFFWGDDMPQPCWWDYEKITNEGNKNGKASKSSSFINITQILCEFFSKPKKQIPVWRCQLSQNSQARSWCLVISRFVLFATAVICAASFGYTTRTSGMRSSWLS